MTEEKTTIIKKIGEEMWNLILYVQDRFEKEYNFKPSIIDTTNIIAQRVMQKKLF